ncbi:MAG: M23 family metallopeptidase [bacterium]|nr:M23 family metallopeptidase [bacterium]
MEKKVKRGDTIINALTRAGVTQHTAYKFFDEVKPVYDLKKIGAGKAYSLFFAPDKQLKRFKYQILPNRYLEVKKDEKEKCFKGKIVTIPYETNKEVIRGTISLSLFESILQMGEKPELADVMASLFEYDIDFNRDLRKNDTFSLAVEKRYLKGQFVGYGSILAAEFINRERVIRIIRYTDPDGFTSYYHPDGRSVKKMFLRCPLPFMRVTSRYGNRRHPVLKFSAKHNGIDLGAPRGTKIRVTSSGVVKTAAYSRYMGKYIIVRHPNRYETHYYHLSRRAKKIKRGTRVEQGQIIGYVGSTGLSTGAHLHYGVRRSGRYMNPLLLKSPSKNPVQPKYMANFKKFTAGNFLLISAGKYVSIPKNLQNAFIGTPITPVVL